MWAILLLVAPEEAWELHRQQTEATNKVWNNCIEEAFNQRPEVEVGVVNYIYRTPDMLDEKWFELCKFMNRKCM